MRESVSFAKLPDGNWGVRFATQGRHPSPGDEAIVNKRDGAQQRVVLGAIVDRDRGAFPGPAIYYRIVRQPSEREQRLSEMRSMYAALRARLRGLEAGYGRNEGYDGEYDAEMDELRQGLAEIERQGKALKAS